MTEEKLIHKQLIKNMFLTFIVFTFIFSCLGTILYTQVESSMYRSSDEELLNSRNRTGIVERIYNDFGMGQKPLNDNGNMNKDFRPQNRNDIMINPRIIYIIRDLNGDVLKIEPNNDAYKNVTFDGNNLNSIYNTTLSSEYKYRAINYKVSENGEDYYVQILINVDAEEAIMQNFRTMLVISLILSVGLALGASYILAISTLKPIVASWKKQTEFVQNASHELRTPLTIIQAKQELLLENPESKIIDKTEDISITLSETRRLSKLVKELMELARSDSNRSKIEKRSIDIDKLIKNVSEPFKEMAKAQGKKLKHELNYGKNISVDENKIHELLVIILDNSMKYTEKGDSITIKTEEKDGKLKLSVADTGIGISDETVRHMFERFYREDKARSRETGGSGLGLSIAESIVNQHGGIISAKHNSPKGTVIEIRLK